MARILFLIPDFEYRGITSQVRLLTAALGVRGFDVRVAALATDGPVAATIGALAEKPLGENRLIDLKLYIGLKRLIRSFRPDVIHAWDLSCLRTLRLVHWGSAKLVASSPPKTLHQSLPAELGLRWCLHAVHVVVVSGPAEAKRWRDLGLAPDRMTTIPPGVNLPPLEPQAPLALPGMTEKSRIVMCVGPLEREKGFYGAIWVLDLLRFLYDNLHLVIVGVGPDRARLEEFAHSIRVNDRVHFIGAIADAPALLQSAELVWVPSETAGGEQVALEAMAAGRPIVASAVASLEELIVDGETGYLVAPEDRITFGKNARRLLDHADARQGVGAAGREHVARHFTVSAMADQFGELYGRLAAGRGN